MHTKKLILLLLMAAACVVGNPVRAQKIIEYVAGMGTRDANNADVWILYNKVKARHEGMTLYADSATYDTRKSSFEAFGAVVIKMTDTTTLYGDRAFYNGNTRIADVEADTVLLVDGVTELRTDKLRYDRNSSTASYTSWGHTIHNNTTIDSRKGHYKSDTRDLYLYNDVLLRDSNSRLETDTLHYNTLSEEASFVSTTRIYSDSATIFSERGFYNTHSHLARSYRDSRVTNGGKKLFCDTLFFNDSTEYGEAYGHVVIIDTVNNVCCYGGMGVTSREARYTFVTDSALVVQVDKGDSLFVHADSLWVFNNENRKMESAKAYHGVRIYRVDVQGACDSLYYNAVDSLAVLYGDPVVWYESYQATADTMEVFMDTAGVRLIKLKKNVFVIDEVDPSRQSQVKGANAIVYCHGGEPHHADILGSAQMVYYVLDDDEEGNRSLLGVNAGVGSDMRIYFKNREPSRVVTMGSPDMKMYPPDQLPQSERYLQGFKMRQEQRPKNRHDVW